MALYVAVTWETGLLSRTRRSYRVENLAGERTTFDDRLEDVTSLGAMLGHQIVERHYPEAAERFNAGEKVAFGPLSIDQGGIRSKGRNFPWVEVSFVSLRRGNLQIQSRTGGGVSLRAATIPNLDIVLLLLDHVIDLLLEE